jgi:hypothetical protein
MLSKYPFLGFELFWINRGPLFGKLAAKLRRIRRFYRRRFELTASHSPGNWPLYYGGYVISNDQRTAQATETP